MTSLPRPLARLGLAALGLLALAAAPARAGAQQPLTLGDALRLADRGAYANRIARGTGDAQGAQRLAALRGILPTVRVEAGWLRTTDPMWTFGNTLRQRSIAQPDFDPARLNHPGAVGNYTGGLVIEQPLVNVDAWAGRAAAASGAAAAEAMTEWTGLTTRAEVVGAYYGAVLATEKVVTLEAAAAAAHGHVRQAEAMVRNGLATKSDALLAAVKAGEIDAQLAAARGDAATARHGLAVLLGRSGGALPVLPARLPSSAAIRGLAAPDTADLDAEARQDVRAAALGLDAARDDRRRAQALYLPRLNGFARYDWNAPGQPFGGEKAWTVGVMASWTPFAGASELAERQATGGRAAAAEAQAEAAQARAALEVEQTRSALAVALQRLDIAERAVAQGAEAHRIVARKYEGGLATVTELLEAQATATATALSLSHARWAVITADAARRQALGRDPAALAALDADPSLAASADTSTTSGETTR